MPRPLPQERPHHRRRLAALMVKLGLSASGLLRRVQLGWPPVALSRRDREQLRKMVAEECTPTWWLTHAWQQLTEADHE